MVLEIKSRDEEENKTGRTRFASRVGSLPVVMTAYMWLAHNYERLKTYNSLVKQACEMVETSVQMSARLVTGTVGTQFKTQLDSLDCLACAQLDRFENAFPLINKDTNTVLNQSKIMLLGSVLMVHKFLDRIEKSSLLFPSAKDWTKSAHENSKTLSPIKQHQNRQGEQEQELAAHSYPPLFVRIRQITMMLVRSLLVRVDAGFRVSFDLLRRTFPCVDRLVVYTDELRRNATYKLHDTFSITKDKLDLYKEYLDVLSRQFLVQDGRSLEHIHSLEERTKIIIRRNIGNLLIMIQLISSGVRSISSRIFFNNPIVALSKKTFCTISELLHKLNNEKLIDDSLLSSCRFEVLVGKLVAVQSCALQWLVPNFDAFGVLDAFDEEMSILSISDDDDDDDSIGHLEYELFHRGYGSMRHQQRNDSIRRQYVELLGNSPLSSLPSSSRAATSTGPSSSTASSSNHLFADFDY